MQDKILEKPQNGPFSPKILISAFVFIAIILSFSSESRPRTGVKSERSKTDMLYELDPSISPVGYVSEGFYSASQGVEDLLSHINYTQPFLFDTWGSVLSEYASAPLFSTVVKIVCGDQDYLYYGSGTNMDSAGYIVTNLHVLDGNETLECMVGFPDSKSGLIQEAYWATPIIDDEKETGHDLALLSVEDPVVDADDNVYGFYERLTETYFPFYEESALCLDTAPKLGDRVYVMGYPTLSGGALTITDGLVSSLYSTDGYIITSAKIGSGNSGGLAVDSDGCFVGVPTAVYTNEEDENYGEIIDAYFVYEFLGAVMDDIEEYRNK